MPNSMRLKYHFWQCSERFETRLTWRSMPEQEKYIILDLIEEYPNLDPNHPQIAALSQDSILIFSSAFRKFSEERAQKSFENESVAV